MDNKTSCLKDAPNSYGIFKTLYLFLSHHKFSKTAETLMDEWEIDRQLDLDKIHTVPILLTRCRCARNQCLQTEGKCCEKLNNHCLEGTFHGETFKLKPAETTVFYVCDHTTKNTQKESVGDNDEVATYEVKELKSKFDQLQGEHHKLIEVTSELTTALQMNILCQTKNINSVLEQCKTIYPTLFSEDRPPSNRSRSPSSPTYSRTRSPSIQSRTSKKKVECSNEVEVYRIGEIGEPRKLRASTPRTPEGSKTPVQRNDFLNLDLEKLNRNSPLSPPLTPDTVRIILESVFERIFDLEKAKTPEKGLIQHLNKEDVEKIVGEVLNEAVKSPSTCGAGEGEYFDSGNSRTKNNNNLYIDYDKLKADLIHSDNDRKIRILQALRWKVTKSDSSTRAKVLESYVNNDLLDLFGNISIPERLLLGYGTDHYVQESICRLINTLASLKQGRDYLTLDERLLKRVLVKKVKDVRTVSGAVTRNMLIASVQKLSIRKQCRNQLVKEGLLEVIIDYMDEFYEKLSKYCLEYCSALLMNLCLVEEAKNRSIKEPTKVVGLIRKFLASENEIYLPYINGIMFSLFEKKELIQEAKNQDLDKIITKLIPVTKDENVKKQLDFILQSRLLGRNDTNVRDDDDDRKEEFDLLEAELDQDDFITQLPSGEALLVEYLTEEKPKSSQSYCGIMRDPPNSARSFSEERKQFTHKPTTEAIFETAKPRRFTTCSQNLLRNSMRTNTVNQGSMGRYPATPLCYMESCQKLENGSSAPCSCSKCVPGRSKYSCGCYEAIRKEIGQNNEELSVIKKYNSEDTKIRDNKNVDQPNTSNCDGRQSEATSNGGRAGSGCKVCGEKRCECAFDPRPKLCRTPTL